MGIRILRHSNKSSDENLDHLIVHQLKQEASIWANIVHEDERLSRIDKLIHRFRTVKHRHQDRTIKDSLSRLQQQISHKDADLVTLQGNMNLSYINNLLTDHS